MRLKGLFILLFCAIPLLYNCSRRFSNKLLAAEDVTVSYLNADSLKREYRIQDSIAKRNAIERAKWDSISIIHDSIFKAERAKYPKDVKGQTAVIKQYTNLIPDNDSVRTALMFWLKHESIKKDSLWINLSIEDDFFTAWFWIRELPLNNETLALIETVGRRTDGCTAESLSSDLVNLYEKDKALFLNWIYTHHNPENSDDRCSIEQHLLWELGYLGSFENYDFYADLEKYVSDPAARAYLIQAYEKAAKEN